MNGKREENLAMREGGGEAKYKIRKVGRMVDRNCHFGGVEQLVMRLVTKSRQEKSILEITAETSCCQVSETAGKVILIIH